MFSQAGELDKPNSERERERTKKKKKNKKKKKKKKRKKIKPAGETSAHVAMGWVGVS